MTRFADCITAWQRCSGRKELPWLKTKDPFLRLVAEVMLQQTQTNTVAPYWEFFSKRWPTAATLAAANRDEVMKAWEGLGYYRRCRMLCDAAERIVKDFDGRTPDRYDELITLPGIGDATAASLAAACSGERRAMIDGNVKRVLARVFRIDGAVGDRIFERRIREIAELQLPAEHDMAAYTQGLMDLGATICRPKRTDCCECPVASICRMHGEQPGFEKDLPRPKRSVERARLRVGLVVTVGEEGVILSRAPKGIWHGLWVPPMVLLPEKTDDCAFTTAMEQVAGISLEKARRLSVFRHELTHRSLEITGWFVETTVAQFEAMLGTGAERKAFALDELPAVPVPVRLLLSEAYRV